MPSTIPLPPREQVYDRCCSNEHTHTHTHTHIHTPFSSLPVHIFRDPSGRYDWEGSGGVDILVLGVWMVVPSHHANSFVIGTAVINNNNKCRCTAPLSGCCGFMPPLHQCLVSGRGAVGGRGWDPTQTRNAAVSTLLASPTKHYDSTFAWAVQSTPSDRLATVKRPVRRHFPVGERQGHHRAQGLL
jgi:hypothetical protein